MINVVPFKRWHIRWLLPEGAPQPYDADTLMTMEKQKSWTVIADGTPIMCGGFLPMWAGRNITWTYMSEAAGPHMRSITRAVQEKLAAVEGRIEMTVVKHFEAGHRWAKMLGFRVENPPGVLEAFGPLGEDHIAYVRVNKG